MRDRKGHELDERLRFALDRIPAPDLWSDATTPARPERRVPRAPSPARRIAIASFALLLFVWPATLLLRSMGNEPIPSTDASPSVVSVSLMLDGTSGVRCTASMPSVLAPGAPLGLRFTLENRSSAPAEVSTFPPSYPVRIRAGDGTTWDTADLMAHSWPMSQPVRLDPGETTTVEPLPLRVQFPGPLEVVPMCAGERMAALSIGVRNQGTAPSAEDAVARAAAAASTLLGGCTPPAGGAVVGSIAVPQETSLTLEARCSATVISDPGFVVVTFTIVTPADAAVPTIPPGLLTMVDLPSVGGNAETIVWRFVVTDSTVIPVANTTSAHTDPAGDSMTEDYEVSLRGWTAAGQSRCGGDSASSGGDGRAVMVTFVDACG